MLGILLPIYKTIKWILEFLEIKLIDCSIYIYRDFCFILLFKIDFVNSSLI